MNDDTCQSYDHLGDILAKVGEGDRAAFRDLYSLTSTKLFGITLRICGNNKAAEDVIADVYRMVWRRAGVTESLSSTPWIWLTTTTRDRALDWRRSTGHSRYTINEELPDFIADCSDNSVAKLAPTFTQDPVKCLALLEEHQRNVIWHAFFNGLTYTQIAQRSNVPLDTIRNWSRRGLAMLTQCLT